MQTQSTHFEKRGDDMNTKREFWQRNAMAVIGMLVFSAGINLFIVPANLYNGGVLVQYWYAIFMWHPERRISPVLLICF